MNYHCSFCPSRYAIATIQIDEDALPLCLTCKQAVLETLAHPESTNHPPKLALSPESKFPVTKPITRFLAFCILITMSALLGIGIAALWHYGL
jgi:hypothetical protein